MPSFALEESLPLIIESLNKCSKITDPTFKWAESRRDAVKGLTNVCQTVGIARIITALEKDGGDIQGVFTCLIECLDEYTVDLRGDVGAWVREASMSGELLFHFITIIIDNFSTVYGIFYLYIVTSNYTCINYLIENHTRQMVIVATG